MVLSLGYTQEMAFSNHWGFGRQDPGSVYFQLSPGEKTKASHEAIQEEYNEGLQTWSIGSNPLANASVKAIIFFHPIGTQSPLPNWKTPRESHLILIFG